MHPVMRTTIVACLLSALIWLADILVGGWLWSLTHEGVIGEAEKVLASGALAAVAAFAMQAVSTGPIIRRIGVEPQLRHRAAIGQRIAAGLLGIAIICMASARYV